jgi:GAF domain-containing protein
MSGADPGGAERLREIAELRLLSPDVDAVLQDAARAAAERLGLPKALVSIVLDEAQYFAAHHGMDGWIAATRGTPIEWSFCVNAVRSGQPFVVEDATTHPAVRDNPLVEHDGVRCYAGIPLVSSRGFALGTLCVLGVESREFTETDLAVLRGLAADAVRRIEARRGEPAAASASVAGDGAAG